MDTPRPEWMLHVRERYREQGRISPPIVRAAVLAGRDESALTPGEREYGRYHAGRFLSTLNLLPDGEGRRLLDVGSFPGHLSALAAVKGWNVSGFSLAGSRQGDSSFESRMSALGIEVRNGDVERDPLPYADQTFDAALFCETVEHLAFNPFHPLNEIWRVLRPGGILILSTPNACRFDTRWAALRGRTGHAPLDRPLPELFPSDIAHRHIREYSPAEIRYMLEAQDKYLYRYAVERLERDRSWDGMPGAAGGFLGGVRPGTLLRALLTRFVPALRSNLLVRAAKPRNYVLFGADRVRADGFLAPEETGTDASFVRAPVRAAWMGRNATVELNGLKGTVSALDLLVVLPAPVSLPPRVLRARAAGTGAWSTVPVAPSAAPRRVRLPVRARPAEGGRLAVELTCDTWRPCDVGLGTDSRDLGVMIAVAQIGVQSD